MEMLEETEETVQVTERLGIVLLVVIPVEAVQITVGMQICAELVVITLGQDQVVAVPVPEEVLEEALNCRHSKI